MGCGISSNQDMILGFDGKDNLNIATLNYSSDSKTPFEFYSLDHYLEESELDEKVKQMLTEEKHKDLNLTIVKIFDAHIKPRYSPLYHQSFGVSNYRFEDEQEFKSKWLQYFIAANHHIKFSNVITELKKQNLGGLSKWKEDQLKLSLVEWEGLDIEGNDAKKAILGIINQIRKYDYIVFKGILKFVYGTNSLQIIFQNRGVAKYLGFMQRFFEKPFLDEEIKEQRIIDFIHKKDIDVLFLQNVTSNFCNKITLKMPNYRLKRGLARGSNSDYCNAAIFFKPSSFRKAYDGKKGNLKFKDIKQDVGIDEKIRNNFLKWEGMQTAVESVGNFILISVDVKNKGKVNQENIQLIKKQLLSFTDHLKLLTQKFPNKYIVIGGIFDELLFNNDDQYLKKLKLQKYPNVSSLKDFNYATCHNVRTYLMSFPSSKLNSPERRAENLHEDEDPEHFRAPTCKNFLIYPKRMNKQPVENAMDFVSTSLIPKIPKGIYITDQSNKNQAYQQPIKIEAFQNYTNNQQMRMKRDELGYLPNHKHPFNEYVVAMNLTIPKRKDKVDIKNANQSDDELDYALQRPFDSSSSQSSKSQIKSMQRDQL